MSMSLYFLSPSFSQMKSSASQDDFKMKVPTANIFCFSFPWPLGGIAVLAFSRISCLTSLPFFINFSLERSLRMSFKFCPPLQSEPRISGQMKAVSAEYLGPILDSTTKNITKSLASLSEIQENGLSFVLRETYSRESLSRTINLPVRGHTL